MELIFLKKSEELKIYYTKTANQQWRHMSDRHMNWLHNFYWLL